MSHFFCPRCNEELSESESRKYGVCYDCLNDSLLASTGGTTFQPLLKKTVQPNPERLRKKEQHVQKKLSREQKEALFSGKDDRKKDERKNNERKAYRR
jgi:hypothetical protein